MGYTVFPLSILAVNDIYLPWFYSQHIQLFVTEYIEEDLMKLDFYRYPYARLLPAPFLDVLYYNRDIDIVFETRIVDFLVANLNKNYYIQLYANEFYMPNRSHYKQQNYTHEILIHGYDSQSEEFYIVGYNHQGQYTSSPIKFTDFEQAFVNVDKLPERKNKIQLSKYIKDRTYEFDLELLKEQLQDYLYSNNTSNRYRIINKPIDGIYGLEIYQYFDTYFKDLLSESFHYDIRNLHILWEHKKCMILRMQFMEENNYLDPAHRFSELYKNTVQLASNIRIIMLRAFLTHRSIDQREIAIQKVRSILEEMAKSEEQIIGNYLEAIS